MTDIPGTGKLTKDMPLKQDPIDETTSIVNVGDIKKGNAQFQPNTESEKSSDLKRWMLIGGGISAVFALLSILQTKFLFFVIVSPVIVFTSWKVKNLTKKMETKKYPFK